MHPEFIWERVLILTDHIREDREILSVLQVQHSELRHRMAELERRQKRSGKRSLGPIFLREVFGMKAWIGSAIVFMLALQGAISPELFKKLILSLLGATPP